MFLMAKTLVIDARAGLIRVPARKGENKIWP
ncbi:MAG: hypothetical protein CM15mP120_20730 [Pseudomonadota bacterium]|nr:MAG: hypothetical protein CM15mP120_20730 [Pseudomonadota bacterium]